MKRTRPNPAITALKIVGISLLVAHTVLAVCGALHLLLIVLFFVLLTTIVVFGFPW